MEKRVSITAKMSAFVRDFHSDKLLSRGELYNDPLAGKMLNGEIMMNCLSRVEFMRIIMRCHNSK